MRTHFAMLAFLCAVINGTSTATETRSPVFLAIRNDDLASVKRLVEITPDLIDETDQNGMTPLYLAAYLGTAEIARHLVETGANVNYRRINGETPLHAAASFDHIEIVELLVESGANIEAQAGGRATPIRYAISGGAKETATYLLDKGAVVPADGSLLHAAASSGMEVIVAAMIEMGVEAASDDGNGGTILHSAAAGGLIELAQRAVAHGHDVNASNRYGTTPLHEAAAGGHGEVVAFLLDSGAKIDLRKPDGRTPCHLALQFGHEEVAEMLAGRGASSGLVRFMEVPGDIYIGEEVPSGSPRVFAVGIVSTESAGHGAPAFSPLGDEIYWASDFRNQRYTRRIDGQWTAPEKSPMNERYGATNPVFSHDGSKLYFHSTSTMQGDERTRDADIWVVERDRNGWGEPRNLGPNVNSDDEDRFPTVTRDGTLYFISGYDIYRAEYRDGGYIARERLPDGINTPDFEMSPCVAPDESFLVFESSRPGGFAEVELYVSFRETDGSWTAPMNMGMAINRGGSRFPGLSPDGRYLFFTNARGGNSDVYWVDAEIVNRIPRTGHDDILTAMHETILAEGTDAAIELYHGLKLKHPGYYDFRESMLNRLGYRLLGAEHYDAAIAIFELNVDSYPDSWNVYDSLAEACMKNRDFETAKGHYGRSLELNTGNDNARRMLERIEHKTVTRVSGHGLTFVQSPQFLYPRNTNDLALGDLDGDGDLDLVCSNMANNHSRVWLNDGRGQFSQTDQELTTQGHGVELADLDDDGDLDAFIACASYGDGRREYNAPSRVYLNDGNGRMDDSGQNLGDLEQSGTGVTLADVDADGDMDALVNYFQHDNLIYLNDGKAIFTNSSKTFPDNAVFADLDGDGDPDFFAKVSEVGYRVALNDGSGAFVDRWELDAPETQWAGDVGLFDIDRDGDIDALVTNGDFRTTATPPRLLLNDGSGAFAEAASDLAAVRNAGLAAGDLNGDGYLDVVATDFERPNHVWLGDGRGGLVDSGIRLSYGEMFRHLCLGDIDGDGDLDLVLANFSRPGMGGPNEVWLNMLER